MVCVNKTIKTFKLESENNNSNNQPSVTLTPAQQDQVKLVIARVH